MKRQHERRTPVLIKVTSSRQCKVSLWGFPYVCLCPWILRCPTARLGPDPRSCLRPQSGDAVLWLTRSLFLRRSPEELVAQPDSDLAHTHQMERNMLTQMICQTSKGWERERERLRERERENACVLRRWLIALDNCLSLPKSASFCFVGRWFSEASVCAELADIEAV